MQIFLLCATPNRALALELALSVQNCLSSSQFGLPTLLTSGSVTMLYTIAVILLILWLLGLVTSYTLGGFIHILLVVAIVVILLRVISGRKPL